MGSPQVMTDHAERMKAELGNLEASDRAALAHFLITSLGPDEEADVEAAWKDELHRRAEDVGNGRVTGEPAERVLGELRTKYS